LPLGRLPPHHRGPGRPAVGSVHPGGPRAEERPVNAGQDATPRPPHRPAIDDFDLDHQRARRRGYPEAVLCDVKTVDQVRRIAADCRERSSGAVLFTRADPERAAAVLAELPDAHHEPRACLVAWPSRPPAPTGGLVVVVSAGTSDLPVALEAETTARYLGRSTELVVDVGVAGLHRVLGRLELLRSARAVVVAAGMDGALPSVVAGLV